jgi:hypothetical protein
MDAKLFLIAALVSVYVAPAFATFPLTFTSTQAFLSPASLGFGSPSAAVGTSLHISGAAMLLGALPLVIGKALLLRRLTGRGRKRRDAINISDEEAAEVVMQLIYEYEHAMAHP